MRSRIYRAACWIPRDSLEPVPLTGPNLRHLDSRSLHAEGLRIATGLGYFDRDGWLEVMPYSGNEEFEVHEVEALRWISRTGEIVGGEELLGPEDCRMITVALAEGRARIAGGLQKTDGFTHTVELTHNLDDTLLPFAIAYQARLRLPTDREDPAAGHCLRAGQRANEDGED